MINYSKSHEWMKNAKYINEFVSLINLSKDDYVMDAGCGSGYVAAVIQPKVKKILQIDHDWAMLSTNNIAKHTETLKCNLSDLWMIGYESFDAIFCRSVMHRLKEPGRAYSEFQRVLKPYGKLVISVSYAPDDFIEEYRKIMSKRGFRLHLTYSEWRDFFVKSSLLNLSKEGKIYFKLDLNEWGLLKEHENASQPFKEYFKLNNGIIECSHAYFVLEKQNRKTSSK